jgi:phospholipid/cholesterol/gamma-HCH transport system substrate-binding protein
VKPFSQRNPIVIGLASLAVIAVLLVIAYRADSLPIIGSGQQYEADFSEAAGLTSGNEVRIAGVKVGKVTSVGLEGNHVQIKFRAKDCYIGNASSASIQIKTLLGEKFLAIDPAGDKPLDPNTPIPLSRTVAPYDVVQAFNQLSTTVGQLNTQQLATSLTTLSQTFANTPADVKASLDGLSRLSVTIASRNDQLAHLLANTNQVSGLLASRDDDITSILTDGSKLLEELRNRESAITRLLDGTQRLSEQLRGLIKDNDRQIGPTLDELARLTKMLQDNRTALVGGIRRIGPFATVFTNSLGNGRWFDSYIDGLLPTVPELPLVGSGNVPSVPNPSTLLPSVSSPQAPSTGGNG